MDDKNAVCQKKNTLEPVERIVPANGQKAYTCCKKADLKELVTEVIRWGCVSTFVAYVSSHALRS